MKRYAQELAGYAVMASFWLLFGYCLLMWWSA